MANDFKANQIRTAQVIASGSNGSNAAIILYGSGSSTNFSGGYTASMTSGVGSDVFLFVSGSTSSRGTKNSKGSTLVGGSLVASGAIYTPLELQGSALLLGGQTAYLTSSDGANLFIAAGSDITIDSDLSTTISPGQNLDIVLPFFNGSEFSVKYVDSGPVYYNALSISPGGGEEPKVLIGDSGYGTASATLDILGSIYSSNIITASLGFSGSLTRLSDGRSYLVAGSNVSISSASNGQITISSTGGGGGGSSRSLFTDPSDSKINATGSLALAGSLGSNYVSTDAGSGVYLFVSGNIGTTSAKSSKIALFGGDLVSSGSIFVEDSTGYTQINQSGGNLTIRNRSLAGQLVASVNTSIGNTVNFLDVRPNGMAVNTKVAILPSIFAGPANPFNSTDTSFFIGGSAGSKGGSSGGTTVVGGDMVISGSTYIGNSTSNSAYFNARLSSDIIPDGNRTRNLGSENLRFANIYTGDLHLRNERGDYTLIEEEDCLTIRFNKNGKRYRFLLERAPEFDD